MHVACSQIRPPRKVVWAKASLSYLGGRLHLYLALVYPWSDPPISVLIPSLIIRYKMKRMMQKKADLLRYKVSRQTVGSASRDEAKHTAHTTKFILSHWTSPAARLINPTHRVLLLLIAVLCSDDLYSFVMELEDGRSREGLAKWHCCLLNCDVKVVKIMAVECKSRHRRKRGRLEGSRNTKPHFV